MTAGPCCGLSPEAQTVGPCGSGSSPGFGGFGGFSGSGTGAFYGPGKSGGRGGVGGAPRPDPAIAARAANRAAARNNPMPIPQAMLSPFYGNSATAPVSTAPHLPSHATGAYQDPVDDINNSYENLRNSVTVDSNTLLGTVKNTITAATEITPVSQPFDGSDADEIATDAYKNAKSCEKFQNDEFGSDCMAMAPDPNFDSWMAAEANLQAIESGVQLFEGIALGALIIEGGIICTISVYCGGLAAASSPEFAAFMPVMSTAVAARGLFSLFGGARGGPLATGRLIDDLAQVEAHLASLPDNAIAWGPNQAMLSRLRNAASSGRPLTQAEQNFMLHELTEARLMAQGISQNDAHALAMKTHPDFANYDPEVIKAFPEEFNSNWFKYWGISK